MGSTIFTIFTIFNARNNNNDASNASNTSNNMATSTSTSTSTSTRSSKTSKDQRVNDDWRSLRLVCTLLLRGWLLAACICFVIVGTAIVMFSLGVLLYFIVAKREWTWEEYSRWQQRRLRLQVKEEFYKKNLKEIAEAA